jgi:hypothetical protein
MWIACGFSQAIFFIESAFRRQQKKQARRLALGELIVIWRFLFFGIGFFW